MPRPSTSEDLVFAVDYSRILAGVLNLDHPQLPALLAGTGLTAQQFLEKEGYISWPEQHRIITNALALYGAPGLGLRAGERYSLMTHGLVGVATMACPTVMEGLQVLARYHPTRAQFVEQSLDVVADTLIIQFALRVERDAVGQFLLDALLVSQASTLRFLLGDRVADLTLELAFPEPDYGALYHEILPGTLSFGHPVNRMLLPREVGDLAVATHDAALQQWAVQQCEQQFERLSKAASFTARTLTILRQTPGRTLGQDQVAYMLNVSPRTLLRKLREEGSTYKQLVDQEQKRLARYYLEHTRHTIESIAEQLGYHDQSSFRRAFKRWFGQLPSEYRR
ncbi:MAG: AraC family transcriptional regulator [Pseudomonadota bacterium]|nr:AraC family transcriptional regulator [Pseudomonadota bacterium]